MLSIRACGGGAVTYFLAVATQAYYLSEGESSLWLGQGAEKLGLTGPVTEHAFRQLFAGRDEAGKKLVQNADSPDRKPGWDLTFSLPKSASVAWAVGSPAIRAVIERAHLEGVRAAIEYLQDTAAMTRRERGGTSREVAGLVVAAFHHDTSRNGDPQRHTHCVTLNVGTRSDGSTGSIVSLELYRAKMTAGAVYQARVSVALELEGIESPAVLSKHGVPKGYFELKEVPHDVCDAFSSRRQEVLSALDSLGFHSAAAAEIAALDTRKEKEVTKPREELFAGWSRQAERLGFSREDADRLPRQLPARDQLQVTAEALEAAKEVLTASVSFFTERMLFRQTLIRTIGKGADPDFVVRYVQNELERSKDFIALGSSRGDRQFTTKEIWATEAELLTSAKALAERGVSALPEKVVSAAIEKAKRPTAARPEPRELSAEQKEAVKYLTQEGGSVRVLSGYAGTGKTATLAAVREAYERAGFRVLGASVAGIAARGLEKGSGIKSDTVAKRLLELERTLSKVVRHHAIQLVRQSLGLPTYKLAEKLAIDRKTVLVVDEAGMLGTKDLAALVKAVEKGGGRLILVGDHRQLPPVGPGGGFRGLAERHGNYELTEVGRQREDWAKQKGKDLADGRAERAIRAIAERGLLTVAEDRATAIGSLVGDWAKNGGIAEPGRHVAIAVTNDEVRVINRDAQALRLTAGELGGRTAKVGVLEIRSGDRVLFAKNDRALGVFNGSLGTVTAVNPFGTKIAVVLDGETGPKVIDLRKYQHITLGYAVTAHRAQGATFENTYVLLGGGMTSQEVGYVVATRERESARFYTDRLEAGDDLARLAKGLAVERPLESDLVKQLRRSAEKQLAHDLEQRQKDDQREV